MTESASRRDVGATWTRTAPRAATRCQSASHAAAAARHHLAPSRRKEVGKRARGERGGERGEGGGEGRGERGEKRGATHGASPHTEGRVPVTYVEHMQPADQAPLVAAGAAPTTQNPHPHHQCRRLRVQVRRQHDLVAHGPWKDHMPCSRCVLALSAACAGRFRGISQTASGYGNAALQDFQRPLCTRSTCAPELHLRHLRPPWRIRDSQASVGESGAEYVKSTNPNFSIRHFVQPRTQDQVPGPPLALGGGVSVR